jgi:hypothetical protein
LPHARERYVDDPDFSSSLERAVAGALRAAIHDHGPITADKIGSAVKRVIGNLANVDGAGVAASRNVARPRRR